MCHDCWDEVGRPTELPPTYERFAELVTDLYAVHAVGGPLHVVLDDWNLDGVISPWYSGYAPGELDAAYYQGWPLAELPPAAPAVVEGLGSSTRQICDEICGLLNDMPELQRHAALARWKGFFKPGDAEQRGEAA